MNIVFGVKNLVATQTRTGAFQKYPESAVVTVEGVKGKGKSRRILFNKKAGELLSFENGSNEQVIFAPIHDSSELLIANLSTVNGSTGDMTSYKVSKNEVSYSVIDGQEKPEKGKGILSSHMCDQIFSFMNKSDDQDVEFELVSFESDSVEAFSFKPVGYSESISDQEDNSSQTEILEELALAPNGNSIDATQENSSEESEQVENIEVVSEEVIEEKPYSLSRSEVLSSEY
jgi:hypothetical protein